MHEHSKSITEAKTPIQPNPVPSDQDNSNGSAFNHFPQGKEEAKVPLMKEVAKTQTVPISNKIVHGAFQSTAASSQY